MNEIYVHETVSPSIADLVIPKVPQYMERLRNFMHKENPDGRGACTPMSIAIAAALGNKYEADLVWGVYHNGRRYVYHAWFSLRSSGQYSFDMTHRQTGSPHMVLIIPSELEKSYNLDKMGVLTLNVKGEHCIRSLRYKRHRKHILEEVYDLFNC